MKNYWCWSMFRCFKEYKESSETIVLFVLIPSPYKLMGWHLDVALKQYTQNTAIAQTSNMNQTLEFISRNCLCIAFKLAFDCMFGFSSVTYHLCHSHEVCHSHGLLLLLALSFSL